MTVQLENQREGMIEKVLSHLLKPRQKLRQRHFPLDDDEARQIRADAAEIKHHFATGNELNL